MPGPEIPGFGSADLSNCEREQIHLAASIQPHGALLILHETDLGVLQASANAAQYLGLRDKDPRGLSLADVSRDLARQLAQRLDATIDDMPVPFRCRLNDDPRSFDALVHRMPEEGIAVEFEHALPTPDLTAFMQSAIQTIVTSLTLRELCDDTARVFKDLSGYDRVMIYRFDEDGHGEVFAERKEAHLEAFQGNRYPASDIPRIARKLYERNRIRVLVDVEYAAVDLVPRVSPLTGRDVDMSMCVLRSVSPIHVQYLKNMGVRATLVVSLMVGGNLWGLISCHHYEPRNISFETKSVCELLAETMATRIAALESFAYSEAELAVRRLEARIVESIARDGDWKTGLFDRSQAILAPLRASGAALCFEGQILTTGEVPGTPEIRDIARWLDEQPWSRLYQTNALGLDEPAFSGLTAVAAGLLCVPISRSRGEYLMWFRAEQKHTVTWGGNPFKPVEVGSDPRDLSPRRSFSQWHQVVEGTSDKWSRTDQAAARMIAESIEDMVYQYRAVRMLIAQDQLVTVSRDVRNAQQPVVVADDMGQVLMANEAFRALMGGSARGLLRLADFPRHFENPDQMEGMLRELRDGGRSWRGEVVLKAADGRTTALLLRADPVLSPGQRILGFVLIFADLTERNTVDAFRRRFQDDILSLLHSRRVDQGMDGNPAYRNLLSSVAANGRLAVMEIADNVEVNTVPGMLNGVGDSVARTAKLLECLYLYRAHGAEDE